MHVEATAQCPTHSDAAWKLFYYYNTGPILSVPRVSALNTEGKQDRMVLQEKYFLSQTSLFSFAFSLASH